LTVDCKFPKNAFRVINKSTNFLYEHKQRIALREEFSKNGNKSILAPAALINNRDFFYSESENSDY